MIEIRIGANAIAVDSVEPMVAGSARIYHCRYTFSPEWDGLDATLYFRNGDVQIAVAATPEGVCEIPWECTQRYGELYVGAIGTDANGTRRVVPEKSLKMLRSGTKDDDAQEPREPTPGMVEQLHALASGAYDRAIEDLERRIESGEFRGEDGTTPHIGENGNWWIGDEDTGIRARGRDGNDHTEAENARASAEQNRIGAENARASAESARESAEQSRTSAESARAASENGRADAENARAAAENSRASAEQTRANNESARQSNESLRANAEQNRVDAESARASAESARANASASAVNAANAAAERAEEAADACASAVAGIPAQMDAAVGRIIDDTAVGASNPWSSQQIVETLCPPMEVSGNPVTCYPVAGSPLNVSARVEPVQHLDWMKREGLTTQDGTPSPDAPIPLVDSVPAGSYYVPSTAPDGGYWRVDLDAALGGVGGENDAVEVDTFTGRYRIVRNTALSVLVGTETVNKYNTSSGTLFRISGDYGLEADSVRMACTHYVVTSGMNRRDKTLSVSSRLVAVDIIDNDFNDTPSFLNYIAAQHAAGTSVTIRYALASPIITTGQATHVTSTTGLTALSAVSMGLTAPDPEHPCEITVADRVQIAHNGDTYDIALPEGFDGGEVDVSTGEVTEEFGKIVLDGTESWNQQDNPNLNNRYYGLLIAPTGEAIPRQQYCTHIRPLYSYNTGKTIFVAGNMLRANGGLAMDFEDVNTWKAYLAAEYAAGHPVTIYYKLATPTTQAITPTPINALSGCNTLATDAQALTVRGHADPIHIITEQAQTIAGLTQRMTALESAVTQ